MTMPKLLKRCRNCHKEFRPYRSTDRSCSPACEAILIMQAKEKKLSREKLRNQGNTRADIVNKISEEIQRAVKYRDWGLPCISCGAPFKADFQAGHYHSRGAYPELKNHLDNIHCQCVTCNIEKGGNKKAYAQGILMRYGVEYYDRLLSLPRRIGERAQPRELEQYLIDLRQSNKQQRELIAWEIY